EPRFIGQILKETADLSDSDILQILLEQKQFEKRRLDLEKALYTVKSELRISKKLNRLFEYSISKDGLEAFVKKRKEIDEAIPIYEFLIWLRRVGIKFGFVDDAVLEKFIQKTEEKSQITVAKGYPAGQCTNETIEFYFENEFSQAQQESNKTDPDQIESSDKEDIAQEKPIEKKQPQELESKDNKPDQEKIPSHKNDDEKDNDPLFFKQGSLLARIIPGKKGKPGKDVLGYPIQPDKPSICILNAGSGVIKKGSVFLARIDGRPVLKNGVTLMVETALQKNEIKTIPGNISNDTKDTYDAATLEVSGIITTEGILRCRSLLLLGNMMGCVICSGDIDIKGNIGTDKETKDKGTLHQADILCQGSVKASKSIMNSKIQTEGELLAFGSTVIGSQVLAFKGMRIKDSLKGVNGPSILQFGIKPGDKSIPLDHTIETKNAELSVLKKETEIAQLTETYNKELKEAENHQLEQTIFKNLVEIIEAPDLYQYNGLEGKIKYLYSLPDFSSVKAYYLKLPETDTALAVLNQIIASTKTMPLENALKQFKDKIDPEPEDQNAASTISRIETDFKARLAAFKREAAEKSEEIEKIENDIKGLQALRAKLGSRHVNSLSPSTSAIKIKNKCEKGTIIKGVFAQLVVEKTLYNVEFKEVIDPTTNTGSIVIETY
ncbi:MAG: FapA family protein, partial [Proteobacteria bacterium]|nr:FapA family protein [Pseudomonadota bacterium]MBU1584250.1 FapA family protein [Pseudomonadota bacterium]MBU2452876.1 FapA family protein [Pseudomonadota bacterium]